MLIDALETEAVIDIFATTTPAPTDAPVGVDDTASKDFEKQFNAHLVAAIADPIIRENLLAYNFDPQVIPYLDVLPQFRSTDLLLLAPSKSVYRGDLFDDVPLDISDLFAQSELNCDTTSNTIQVVEPLTCGWVDRGILSMSHGVVEKVKNAQACQHLCQYMSDAINWAECSNINSKETSTVLNWLMSVGNPILGWFADTSDQVGLTASEMGHTCSGMTYMAHTQTCILHERIDAIFPLTGVQSALSICKGGSLALEKVAYNAAQDNSSCLQDSLQRIRYFTKEAIDYFSSRVSWSHKKYYPRPNLTQEELDKWQNAYENHRITEPRHLLGELTYVNSVVACLILCATDNTCAHWNWLAIGTDHIVCYKTQNYPFTLKPMDTSNAVDSIRSGSGSREIIPKTLIDYMSEEDLTDAQAHATKDARGVDDCVFQGYLGHSAVVDSAHGMEFTIWNTCVRRHEWQGDIDNYQECQAACQTLLDCRAWSYGHNCQLFNAEFPRLLPSLNSSDVTGFNRLGSAIMSGFGNVSLCWDKVPAQGSLVMYETITASSVQNSSQNGIRSALTFKGFNSAENPSQNPERSNITFSYQNTNGDDSGDVNLSCSATEGLRLPLVSIKGTLCEDDGSGYPNMLHTTSSTQCLEYCKRLNTCVGWTYGTWGGCYLFETVDQLISDSNTISGLPNCQSPEVQGLTLPKDTNAEILRDTDTCVNMRAHIAYGKGTMLDNFPRKYHNASQCWLDCRATDKCFGSIFISNYNDLLDLESQTEPATVDSTPGTNCVFFEDVDEAEVVTHKRAVYIPSNCDSQGTKRFGLVPPEETPQERLIIATAVLIVLVLLAVVAFLYFRYKGTDRLADQERSPLASSESPEANGARCDNPQVSPRLQIIRPDLVAS